MPDESQERVAVHGKKMIEIRVRLWTDNIADSGKILPKHAWDAGVVYLSGNASHGIETTQPAPFNGFAELPRKIEKLLIDNEIKIHLSQRARKYLVL